uniref:Prefoldin subunit 1 n=1 Tax=Panthera leo TaxID=9689 RepID=A0A8C8Y3U6_PANLE
MGGSVDLELQTTFAELQGKVIDTQQKVKLADVRLEQLNRMKKHAHLTDKEIMCRRNVYASDRGGNSQSTRCLFLLRTTSGMW